MFKRCPFQIAFLSFALLSTGFGAAPSTEPSRRETAQPQKGIAIRVYDISDLLWRMNDYPAPVQKSDSGGIGGVNGGGGGFSGSAAADQTPHTPRSEVVDSFIKLIQDTVASDTWKTNGGNLGSIREVSGQLVVTQTPENHRGIAELLKALRDEHGRMVVVRAYWLLLEPQAIASIASAGQALPIIDDKLIDAKHLYCGAQTICFSGQTVHVTSGRKRAVIADLSPVVGANAVGYNPTMESVRSGVVLQVTPQLEPEGQDARIILDLQSSVTEQQPVPPRGSNMVEPTTQPAQPFDWIDRVNEISQELRTTVRMPLRKKILVGGMTLEPAAREEASRQLYLVIEADAVK